MDANLRKFAGISTLVIIVFCIVLITFGFMYRYSSVRTYNLILLLFIGFLFLVIALFILALSLVTYAYKRKYVGVSFIVPVKIGLMMLVPLAMLVSRFFKGNRDFVRAVFIDINNIVVHSAKRKYAPGEVLMLLPHCIQNYECQYKVTNDIRNCRRCNKCCIGDMAAIAEETGVRIAVVTGGTAARNIVNRMLPKMILSVACERDLASGIADVKGIPVIGIVNERPFGPCINTTVDMDKVRERLQEILKEGRREKKDEGRHSKRSSAENFI